MEHMNIAIEALAATLKKANGRRKRRLMSVDDILALELPAELPCKIYRDWTLDGHVRRGRFFARKKQGRATAALLFRHDDQTYVVLRAVKCNVKNGFTDVIWGGKLRSRIDPFQCETCKPLWLPSRDDLQVYSDFCEDRGFARVA